MNWKAANEQQDEARWRVFLMFVAMALMVIRTGLVSRGLIAALPFENARQDGATAVDHQALSTPPSDLRQATLVLLCLAEAAGHSIIMREREVWELMNQPLSRPAQLSPHNTASLYNLPAQRLDTS